MQSLFPEETFVYSVINGMYYVWTDEVDALATHVAGCFKTLVFLSGMGIYRQT